MNERLLQFIWQFQYFNKHALKLKGGETLQILHPGFYNTQQGPDFTNARIRIGKMTFAGSVELHIKTSDWAKHNHSADNNYKNVVLHVVWEHDRKNRQKLPLLILQNRVSHLLLDQYRQWMERPSFIPCNFQLKEAPPLTWKAWKDRLLAERLLRKSAVMQQYLGQTNQHWDESFWWLLARQFGIKVNAAAFEAMARTIPFKILSRHKNQLQQLEALLLGQAGLLNKKFRENYARKLKAEYQYQQKKYKLTRNPEPVFFLRMRPDNFPSVRLAQLARLIHKSVHLFSEIKETLELSAVKEKLNVTASTYWDTHYVPGEKAVARPKHLGKQMVDVLIINVVCPALFAWGHIMAEEEMKARAMRWLEETDAESNKITRGFEKIGIENNNACDSQSLIELKTSYCDEKRCLDCAVGNILLKGAAGREPPRKS
jgi:hypothetical protein